MDHELAAYVGATELPGIAGQFSGRLLILGGARCVWDDVVRLCGGLEKWPHDIMAVNDIGQHVHQFIRHWATLHPEYMPGWLHYRIKHNYGNRGHVFTHSTKPGDGIQFAWEMPVRGGSSGIFAAIVALLMGYERVVLAGMPMDGQGHFFDPPWVNQAQFGKADLDEWQRAAVNGFANRVRSMSGNTAAILGAPE